MRRTRNPQPSPRLLQKTLAFGLLLRRIVAVFGNRLRAQRASRFPQHLLVHVALDVVVVASTFDVLHASSEVGPIARPLPIECGARWTRQVRVEIGGDE